MACNAFDEKVSRSGGCDGRMVGMKLKRQGRFKQIGLFYWICPLTLILLTRHKQCVCSQPKRTMLQNLACCHTIICFGQRFLNTLGAYHSNLTFHV